MSELPGIEDVQRQLDGLALGLDACELHGSLCGLLCAGGALAREDWLARVALDDEVSAPPSGSALDRLFLESRSQLDDPDFGFALLLPPDRAEVAQRAESLLAWCRGFLGGFGLGAGARPPLSAESGEALEDLARIARSDLAYEDPEADESALMEITEFVRVAALLLHSDCSARQTRANRLH